MKKVAVILSGCGVYDGSEIHEATAALLALDRAGAEAVICAPAGPQMHVINHLTGEPAAGESRDVLVESARIARGAIRDLAELDVGEVDAVLLPGGFGAAKNLCDFAVEGAGCQAHPGVEKCLREFHAAGKPIGAFCIAPAILARLFGEELAVSVTIGSDEGTAQALQQMGARHVNAPATGVVVDEKNKVVTGPAYMLAQRISEVFDGIAELVDKVLALS